MVKVGIMGMGYVGLPLAIAAQRAGYQVVGFDTDPKRVEQIQNSHDHLLDYVNLELIREARKLGLTATVNSQDLKEMDIVVICVPTPLSTSGETDLTYLEHAVKIIASVAKRGTLLINESTSMPGTIRSIIPQIVASVNPELELEYAVSPERIDPGNGRWGISNTPRLVGGLTRNSTQRATKFYESFCVNVIQVRSPEVAELAKLLENTFRLVNISLVNELVPLAESLNVSMHEVVKAASTKPYGFTPFIPGVGIGGHCIPVDPVYLHETAHLSEISLAIVDSALRVNSKILHFIIEKSLNWREVCENRVLVLGVSYKKGVSDTRESAALALISKYEKSNWFVNWWDPIIVNQSFNISDYKSSECLIVVTQEIEDIEIRDLVLQATRVIDCTGQFRGLPNVESF